MNVLIVRLGALGDIVHTIPAAAAIRATHPGARIDWLVETKHRGMVDLAAGIDRVVTLDAPTPAGWVDVVRRLRQVRYDVALDFQGLMKSAVLARASGAARVIGFSIWHLREKSARPFYSEVQHGSSGFRLPPSREAPDTPRGFRLPPSRDALRRTSQAEDHVIQKNLRLLTAIGIETEAVAFPLRGFPSAALDEVTRVQRGRPFALVNPGAAWPNKRWAPERFGEVAAFLRDVRGLASVVLWGPDERPLAQSVVDASSGAARIAPPTTLVDLLELSRAASLMISGDTGPLHIAAAASTPIVAIFGPTDPARNGPWSKEDEIVSRYAACGCHYQRRCHRRAWCLDEVGVAEVTAAIQQRCSGLPRP